MQQRLEDVELIGSTIVTSVWTPPIVVFVCPRPTGSPEGCECGYVGPWETRSVFTWQTEPGHRRSDDTIRRDLARGLPARSGDEGWWVTAGHDERCPGCGDIERLDPTGRKVTEFREDAVVVDLP
jgi:hypothetical protein